MAIASVYMQNVNKTRSFIIAEFCKEVTTRCEYDDTEHNP